MRNLNFSVPLSRGGATDKGGSRGVFMDILSGRFNGLSAHTPQALGSRPVSAPIPNATNPNQKLFPTDI